MGSGSGTSAWRRFTAAYHRLLCVLLVVLLAILVFPVTLQIVSRFTNLLPHYIWTEEMARFLFVWVIMLGSIVGVREWSHFDVDVWPRLSRKPDAAVRLLGRFAVLGLGLVFLIMGWEFTEQAFYRISELAELPLWVIHIAWPVAGLSWILFLAEQIYDDARILAGATS